MSNGRFALSAAAVLLLAACAGHTQPSESGIIPSQSVAQRAPDSVNAGLPTAGTQPQILFAASLSYDVAAFGIPFTKNSIPVAALNVDEPVPLAVGKHNLFVGSFSDGAVYRYKLPLTAGDAGEKLPIGFGGAQPASRYRNPLSELASKAVVNVGVPSGIAVGRDTLFVAGASQSGREEVLAYSRPISAGQAPYATLTYGSNDFLSLASAGNTLYVASTTLGTVRAYATPLTTNAKPEYTIHFAPQTNAAISVAVSDAIYVTDYTDGDVLVYHLPYRNGEAPITLDLKSADQGNNPVPYGVAADRTHLYVSGLSSDAIYQYRLPIVAGEKPGAALSFSAPTGLAVWPNWNL